MENEELMNCMSTLTEKPEKCRQLLCKAKTVLTKKKIQVPF
uniref:Uncharacterized protein n=1 Tax=Anguilla anguilla TaxID=7936 RepID=A0A0E9SH61_ANGAN